MLNTPHIIRTMNLNKRACLPVGNRFYCIQHSNHIKTLAHLHCKSEKQKQKQKLPVSPRLLLYNSRITRSTPLSYYVSTLDAINCCVASCTLKKVNTWTGVCRVDFGDPEREKGACDIEVDTIETLACVTSVYVGLGFFVRSKHFSLLDRKRSGRRGRRREERKRLPAKPTILKNPYANECQSNQVS